MVCATWNESTASPHANGKTKSQQRANNRIDMHPDQGVIVHIVSRIELPAKREARMRAH
jgi:hypothetical protein